MGVTLGVTISSSHFVGTNMSTEQNKKSNTGEGAPQAPKDTMLAEAPVKAANEEQTPKKSVEELRRSQIFGRLSVQISPPKGTSTPAAEKLSPGNITTFDYKWDHDEHKSIKKRKIEETSLEEELRDVEKARILLARKYKQLTTRLEKETKALCQIVRENQNTNRKIKEVSYKLESTVSQMNTEEMHELLNTLGQEGIRKMAPDVPTPHCEECKKKYHEEQEALRKRIAILSVITNNPSAGQLTEIVNTDWPDELYGKSKLVEGSILSPANERDVIVITGTQNMENKPLIKVIIGRQPHMERAIMEVAKEGKVVYASNTCSVSTESGTHGEEVQRYTFIAGVDDRECGEEEADQRLVGVLQKLKGICKLRDLRRLSLSVADLMTGSRLRKLIEYVYQDEEVDIEVYTGARKRVDLVQEQETVGVEEWRTVSRSREKIVVKKVGNEKQMTYADLLKKMQTTIKVRDLGIKIKNIREAKNGNIEITAAGKNEGKEAFIKLIEEKMQGTVEAQKIKPKRKIFIKDLHETTTGEEVRETLSKLFGEKRVDANDISVSMATKPNKGGKLFAIVNLPIEAANILMKMAKLTVGWSECRIEDMNTPRRCYRCLRFGHVRAECKSERSLEDCCLKCGRAGHTARLCTDEPYCIACDVEGHRADEMACPEYKKLVTEKRGGKIEQPTRVGDVRAIESRRGRGRGRGAYAETRLSLPKNEEVAGISGARQE
jgi:hypothetical protein